MTLVAELHAIVAECSNPECYICEEVGKAAERIKALEADNLRLREMLDDDVSGIIEGLPRASSDWMFGYREIPNAFIFVRDGRLNILPSGGGWLGIEIERLLGDVAPFSD